MFHLVRAEAHHTDSIEHLFSVGAAVRTEKLSGAGRDFSVDEGMRAAFVIYEQSAPALVAVAVGENILAAALFRRPSYQ